MTTALDPEFYGDGTIAIYLPSRYRDGTPIPFDLLEQKEIEISGTLTKEFGGSTSSEVNLGTYEHEDDRTDRIVDEKIRRVWTSVKREILVDKKTKDEIFSFASRLGGELDQERMAVEWGPELWGIPAIESGKLVKRILNMSFATYSTVWKRDM